jgi:3-methyladenine DNA glycosylase AlkD
VIPNNPTTTILSELHRLASPRTKEGQARFGISGVENLGLTVPKMRALAKTIGRDHALALKLWKTGVHEARHIAVMIADPKLVDEALMEKWVKDFNSWDIVDGCCGTLFDKTPLAFEKAIEWSSRNNEFEKRAGFTMMATLAVHDKKANDAKFEQFFPHLIRESSDPRNFVKKAINWAIRQIGKRNGRLCKKAIALAREIHAKSDSASKWIASDALRELLRYQAEGKIKNIGKT